MKFDSAIRAMYRGGQRLGSRVQSSAADTLTSSAGRIEGLALVTGGLGGLGLVTAEALVEAGAQCVVLVSRSGSIKYTGQGLESRLAGLLKKAK
jgi:hypothetical protein